MPIGAKDKKCTRHSQMRKEGDRHSDKYFPLPGKGSDTDRWIVLWGRLQSCLWDSSRLRTQELQSFFFFLWSSQLENIYFLSMPSELYLLPYPAKPLKKEISFRMFMLGFCRQLSVVTKSQHFHQDEPIMGLMHTQEKAAACSRWIGKGYWMAWLGLQLQTSRKAQKGIHRLKVRRVSGPFCWFMKKATDLCSWNNTPTVFAYLLCGNPTHVSTVEKYHTGNRALFPTSSPTSSPY